MALTPDDRAELERRILSGVRGVPSLAQRVQERVRTRLDQMMLADEALGHRDIRVDGLVPDVLEIHTDAIECLIIESVGRTGKDIQYSVTKHGDVFTSKRHGFTQEHDRLYVTGTSPVLASVAAHHYRRRELDGGRMYLKHRSFVDAKSHRVIAMLFLSEHAK